MLLRKRPGCRATGDALQRCYQQFGTLGHAQDMGKVVALRPVGVEFDTRREIVRHVKPLQTIVCAHERQMRRRSFAVKGLE